MIAVAITGSFACGKTFILKYLEKSGYKVFSCDDYVKNLYSDPVIQERIIDILSLKTFDKNLIRLIYKNPVKRQELESYVHPLVRAGIKEFQRKYIQEKFLFVEIPLLFETGFSHNFDYSICVYCSEENRIKRAMERGNFDLEIYDQISKLQLPQIKKREMADFCINNDENFLNTKNQINQIIKILK